MAKVIQFPRARRRHVRLPACQPVALVHDNATVATGILRNLSLGGMQIVCDRYTSDSLHPSDRRPLYRQDVRIDAHFKLPLAEGAVKLDIGCRLSYVLEIEGGDHLLGLEFVSLPPHSRAALERFFEESRVIEG